MVDVIGKVESDNTSCPLGSEVRVLAFGVFHLSGSGVRGQKVRISPGVEPMAIPVLGEDNSVYGSVESWAMYVMIELVAATLGGASELASADLRRGSPRRDPRVVPGAEHAGGNGWGGGFGDIYVF